ncbi:hypothetical protein TVAG_344510 [Trichomonas vaginalis G3]|uniref:Uncharacterized protein n=1 Tax=Trichomonas vaginalis (strain ATCC PRA-98 / G3) TaxID=412133 RepID=A2FRG5_TRIV3|nr:sensory perception of sound protein family [Trichomonas vaginalis G3]EAX92495.1 hypothetical protein TVAG_344510 [Trichomonas vaginalis G3]KAI5498297.1 sensory perception of sound protein family [Trichomonas vaginalis G3]|eukprot:XP_001305425.1 hypothetical protein [Trichomonas vaginalis G3]
MTELTPKTRTVLLDKQTYTLENCIFQNLSTSSNQGSAIYYNYNNGNGALFIIACRFLNCNADRSGGAIRAQKYQTFEINTTTAENCRTGQSGDETFKWGQFVYADSIETSHTTIKSVTLDKCPGEIVDANQRPLRIESTTFHFTDSNISNCACSYCFAFYAGHCDLDVSYINVVNGSAYAVAVELEYCTGSLKHISFDHVKQEYANMSVIYYFNSTVTMDAFSFTNYDINISAHLFGYSKKGVPSGHATLSHLVCNPEFHNVQEADPNETPAPEKPTQEPEKPTQEPEKPTPAPEKPTQEPENPTQEPEKPTPAPEKPTQEPEKPTPAPEKPTPAPEKPTQEPEKPTQEPENPTQEPEKPTQEPTQISSSSGQPANVDERKAEKGGLGSGAIVAIVIVVIVVIVVIIVVVYFFVIRKNHDYKNDIGSDTGSAETEEEIPAPGAVADEKMMGRTVDYQTKDDSIVYATQTNGPDVDIVP